MSTYAVVGYSPFTYNEQGDEVRRLWPAMNLVEIAQQRQRAQRVGMTIEFWRAQTKTGERILTGNKALDDDRVKAVKMITCPICEGEGKNGRYHCMICDGSGISRPGHERGWRTWQLDEMRKDRKGE